MVLSPIDIALMTLGVTGELLLLFVLFQRRVYNRFPIFFGYIAFSLVCDLLFLLWFRHLPNRVYFVAYFAMTVPALLLQLGVLFEVARNVLNPVKRSLPRSSLILFAGLIIGGAVLACLLSIHSASAQVSLWSRYFVQINFTAAILQLLIFSAIVLFSQMLGIGWKNHVMQIASGFAGFCIVVLAVELLHRFGGIGNDPVYHLQEQFRLVAWCVALGYWSYVLAKKEAPRKEFSPQMERFLVSISRGVSEDRAAAVRFSQK